MTIKQKILVVEDEEAIRTGLVDVFVYHGFEVDAAVDGQDGLAKSLSGQYDLILLDVMLPKKNGFEICEAVREHDRQQPVIMLTAKSADEDIIQGLTLGADDYVAKPFSVAQLVLRVQAVLRRSLPPDDHSSTFTLSNGFTVDRANLEGQLSEKAVSFTRREMDVLDYLRQNHQRPVSREELLERVWGYAPESGIETRTVDIHVAKLRRKMELDPSSPTALVTIRGAGYRLHLSD